MHVASQQCVGNGVPAIVPTEKMRLVILNVNFYKFVYKKIHVISQVNAKIFFHL